MWLWGRVPWRGCRGSVAPADGRWRRGAVIGCEGAHLHGCPARVLCLAAPPLRSSVPIGVEHHKGVGLGDVVPQAVVLGHEAHQLWRGAVVGKPLRGEPLGLQHEGKEVVPDAHALAALVHVEVEHAGRVLLAERARYCADEEALAPCLEQPEDLDFPPLGALGREVQALVRHGDPGKVGDGGAEALRNLRADAHGIDNVAEELLLLTA
mmetsp:Transcript_48669/g.155748  ORF Transcript_48669/g.155748 Transcript_48669/m.155748 type:complete len:209 (-) Transcript_48669:1712-2338(-)